VLLYFYVAAVTNQFPKKKWIVLVHIVSTVVTLLYIIFFFTKPAAEKIAIFKSQGQGYETFMSVMMVAVIISGIVYIAWSILLLRRHLDQIRDQFSDIEEISLNWLRLLIYGLGLIWVVIIFTQNDTLIFLTHSLFVILVGFFGIQQKSVIDNQDTEEVDVTEEERKEEYAKSGLKEAVSQQLYKDFTALMEEEAVYERQELSFRAGATNAQSTDVNALLAVYAQVGVIYTLGSSASD